MTIPQFSPHQIPDRKPVVLRYWGSHLKSLRMARKLTNDFRVPIRKGWESHLVCSQPPSEECWLQPVIDAGIRVHYLPRPSGNWDLRCVLRAYRLCKLLDVDIFHCDNMHTSPLIGAALAGVPVRLWSKRSMNSAFEECRKPTLRDRIVVSVRLSCLLATKTLAVSSAVRDELLDLGISDNRIQILNNPVDRTIIPDLSKPEARAELGIREEEFVFIAIGHAVRVKGWDTLLRAYAEACKIAPYSRLILAGSTTSEQERDFFADLNRIIQENRISDNVLFLGHVSDIRLPLAASDVLVLPSRSEGHCNALIEGLTAGLPCISTMVGSAKESIIPGKNGYLVPREDWREMARCMTLIASDAAILEQLACGTREPVGFPLFEDYGEDLGTIYQDLLNANQIRS